MNHSDTSTNTTRELENAGNGNKQLLFRVIASIQIVVIIVAICGNLFRMHSDSRAPKTAKNHQLLYIFTRDLRPSYNVLFHVFRRGGCLVPRAMEPRRICLQLVGCDVHDCSTHFNIPFACCERRSLSRDTFAVQVLPRYDTQKSVTRDRSSLAVLFPLYHHCNGRLAVLRSKRHRRRVLFQYQAVLFRCEFLREFYPSQPGNLRGLLQRVQNRSKTRESNRKTTGWTHVPVEWRLQRLDGSVWETSNKKKHQSCKDNRHTGVCSFILLDASYIVLNCLIALSWMLPPNPTRGGSRTRVAGLHQLSVESHFVLPA